MLHYAPATRPEHLQAIVDLQRANLPAHIGEAEASKEGFVSLQHDVELLARMNTPHGHAIALDGHILAGYALVMDPIFAKDFPDLEPMFEELQSHPFHGRIIPNERYVIMGQIAVAKNYRGQGVVGGLYKNLAERLSVDYDILVTEISGRNPRSLRAHEKVGLETVVAYDAPDGSPWVIVATMLANT